MFYFTFSHNFVYVSQTTGMTPLMYAVKDNRTSFVERLIELGSDVGARNNVSISLSSYCTAIADSLQGAPRQTA